MTQSYTSAKTARRQVPGAFKAVAAIGGWKRGAWNLDVGGGPWDDGTEWLRELGVRNLVYDPFNRTPTQNDDVFEALSGRDANTATLCNVLNVIAEQAVRREALQLAADRLARGGSCYVDVYEGDGTGKGRPTAYGWQEHRRLRTYLDEVAAVFPHAELVRGRGLIRGWR